MLEQPILNEIIREIPDVNAQWEVYFIKRKIFSVEGKDLEIDRKKNAFKELFSIRVIKDARAGYSNCNEKSKINEAFLQALKIAEISDPDEFIDIPEPQTINKALVFDENLLNIQSKLPELLLTMQESAFFDKRVKKLRNAEITVTIDEKGVINSKGVAVYQPFTTITAHIIAIAEDEDSQMAWIYRAERFLKNLSVQEIGRLAGSKALMLLKPRKINSFKGFAVFDPYVANEFIDLIAHSFSAENYLTGKSLFVGKIGRTVLNPNITVIDDGLIPERFGTSPFDAEGLPTIRKNLIKDGVLISLLHNTYTAKRLNTKSTGNAARTDRGLSVAPTNLYIEWNAAKLTFDELIKNVDKGIYVLEVMGMHTANPISGDFSVGVSGIYIENGELKHPVKEVVVSGGLIEMFKNIKAVGNDLTFVGNTGAPTLLVEGIDFSG